MTTFEVDLEVDEKPAHWVQFDLNGAGKVLAGFSCILYGWSVKNVSSSTLASFDVYDGVDTSGSPVFSVNLAANETNRDPPFSRGVWMKNGIYLNVTAQEVKGSIFFRHYRPG